MQIKELSPEDFEKTYRPQHVFNSVAFSELNRDKVERLHFLSIEDSKPRLGITLGERDNTLRSPFSAPYGGFIERKPQGLEHMEEAARLLYDYAKERHQALSITLQPLIYNETQLSKWVSVFSRLYRVRCIDLNYHVDLSRIPHYEDFIDRSARKNLQHALKEPFHLVHLNSADRSQVEHAYSVIRRNREERGFPLRMTLEQVWQTVSRVIKADFFVLEHNGNDVAAAQVFHVADGIAQVVYWGDIRDYSTLCPMNYLTHALFEHYYEAGLRILDIGPSTENGIPNYGLCQFKENIGCSVTLKYSFEAK